MCCVLLCRDLKPANLMIGGAHSDTDLHRRILLHELGTLKIADFGLSKSLKLHRADPAENTPDNSSKGVGATPDDSARHKQQKLAQSYKLTGETGSYR